MHRVYICLCLCLVLLSACSRNASPTGGFDSAYHHLLRKHTKEQKLYGVERVYYKTSIAFRSCDLREAYVKEYADVYKLKTSEYEKMLEEELSDCQKYDAFVVSHFASDRETKKLDKIPGVWKLTMSSGGVRDTAVDPNTVMALPGDKPVQRYFYPFITPWSKNYLIKFPHISSPGRPLTIYMDGVEDNVMFSWNQ